MVQQPDMCEVKILMSPDFQKLAQFTNIYPIGHNEEQLMSQTTSQYPHTEKHSETTQEEIAAPGKLPETPLRMDPDLWSDVTYSNEFKDTEPSPSDQNEMGSPPKEVTSSYS
ncbi:hypothetical protein GOODEAATRI_031074, partial [Goodea atripinnis]